MPEAAYSKMVFKWVSKKRDVWIYFQPLYQGMDGNVRTGGRSATLHYFYKLVMDCYENYLQEFQGAKSPQLLWFFVHSINSSK